MTTFMTYKEECEALRQRVADLEKERDSAYKIADHYRTERDKAMQYWQIAEGRCDALKQQRDELVAALYMITKRPVIEAFSIAEEAIASVKEALQHQIKMLFDPIVRQKMLEPAPPIYIEADKFVDPRIAELEAVLRECREALVPYMKYVDGTNVLNHPAQCVAKIDEVLNVPDISRTA